jgi:hypothetical protein
MTHPATPDGQEFRPEVFVFDAGMDSDDGENGLLRTDDTYVPEPMRWKRQPVLREEILSAPGPSSDDDFPLQSPLPPESDDELNFTVPPAQQADPNETRY